MERSSSKLLLLLGTLFCIARCQVEDPCNVTQVHIQLGDAYYNSLYNYNFTASGDPLNASLFITWQTNTSCDDARLELYDDLGILVNNITFSELTVTSIDQLITSDSMDPSDNGTTYISYAYTASLFNLESMVSYSYSIVRDDSNVVVGPININLPGPNDNNTEINLLVYADIDNSAYGNLSINNAFVNMAKNNPSQFNGQLCLGDIAYNIYSHAGLSGEYFYNSMEPLNSIWPFMITPGNHEYQFNYSFLNFRTAQPLNATWANQYYSFNYGPAHFLAVDYIFYTDVDNETQQEIWNWVVNDLENYTANKETWPWLIVYTHYPVYCSYNLPPFGKCSSYPSQFGFWGNLWYEYKVDLVLGAHVHYWERMGPIYNGTMMPFYSPPEDTNFNYIMNPEAPIYTIDGSAGNADWMANMSITLQPFSINYNEAVGYSTLKIYNASCMYYAHWNSDTGALIDYFYVMKGPAYPYADHPEKDPIFWKVIVALIVAGFVIGLTIYGFKKFGRLKVQQKMEENSYKNVKIESAV